MYKIVVVDDNFYDNRGVCQMLRSIGMDIEIIGCFAKADDALNEIPNLNPDIILTDIFMPGINGIDMIKILRNSGLETHTIFMSSYDDFEFAKAGIDLGVDCYLLKPFFEDDLTNALTKVISRINAEISQKKTFENALAELEKSKPILENFFLRQLLYGSIKSPTEIKHQMQFLDIDIMCNQNFCVTMIHLLNGTDISDYLISLTLKKHINIIESKDTRIFSFIESKHTHVLMLNSSKSKNDFNNFTLDFLLLMKQKLEHTAPTIDMRLGVSQVQSGINSLPVLFQQAKNCVEEQYLSENSDIIIYDQIENSKELSFFSRLDYISFYNNIKQILMFPAENDISLLINQSFADKNILYPQNYLICWLSALVSTIRIILHEMNITFNDNDWNDIINSKSINSISSVSDTLDYATYIFNAVQSRLFKKAKSEHYEIAEKIKAFIKENYMNPINVSDITEVVFLSSKYANKIFKNIEGVTIFDYLLQYRIEKAKVLLRGKDSKIYSVASDVGYNNISHFCYVFKKFTGISPNDYKTQFKHTDSK